jgi:hypothetical protein
METALVGSSTCPETLTVQPFASVTVTLYNPADRPEIVLVVCVGEVFHEYEYCGVPPVTVTSTLPSVPPKHEISVTETVAASTLFSVMVTEPVLIHPLASVTVTVYPPALSEFAVDEV